jgi:hypothetical protein
MFVAAPRENQSENDLQIETVEDMRVVNCIVEPISGSFEVPCEGVIFFMWDNSYDWSSNKEISYTIQVKQVKKNVINPISISMLICFCYTISYLQLILLLSIHLSIFYTFISIPRSINLSTFQCINVYTHTFIYQSPNVCMYISHRSPTWIAYESRMLLKI